MESTDRIGKLEVTTARHEERINTLEDYQAKQNGCLRRVEDKLDALSRWLVGLMGGMVVSLILLVVNLLARR